MTGTNEEAPKVFISYSWSSVDHEAWVVEFAEQLVSQGIHVLLDKWDLQPGHDANAFMESMVTDPTVAKVILISDKKYAEKSNSRSGGAGTEAQIITPELYAKKAQDKYVAVVRERDDEAKPYLPVYYGSRIYIDLTNPATYGAEFDRVVRWAWGQPLHVRPQIGTKPSFLSPAATGGKIATAVALRRALDAVRASHPNAAASVSEYLNIVAEGLESFRITMQDMTQEQRQAFDDQVVQSISDFKPYRDELIELIIAVAQYNTAEPMLLAIHRFFERLLPYLKRPEHVNSWNEIDFDNFRFIVHELFLYNVATFIKFEKFNEAAFFINNEYYFESDSSSETKMKNYRIFREYMKILEHRDNRLSLRRLSLRADMIKDRNAATGIDFKYLMTADFVLYLRSMKSDNVWDMWWPETLLYVGRFGGAFEMFARAKSARYFDKIKVLLGVESKAEVQHIVERIIAQPDRMPRWEFERVNPARIINLDTLASVP